MTAEPDWTDVLGRPYATTVAPAWLDYNGHVTDSAYAVIVAAANEELFDALDLGEAYRRETGNGVFTAEMTIRYRHEIKADATIGVVRTITRLGRTSIVIAATVLVDEVVAAETEHRYVHVGAETNASAPFTDAQRARIEPLAGPA